MVDLRISEKAARYASQDVYSMADAIGSAKTYVDTYVTRSSFGWDGFFLSNAGEGITHVRDELVEQYVGAGGVKPRINHVAASIWDSWQNFSGTEQEIVHRFGSADAPQLDFFPEEGHPVRAFMRGSVDYLFDAPTPDAYPVAGIEKWLDLKDKFEVVEKAIELCHPLTELGLENPAEKYADLMKGDYEKAATALEAIRVLYVFWDRISYKAMDTTNCMRENWEGDDSDAAYRLLLDFSSACSVHSAAVKDWFDNIDAELELVVTSALLFYDLLEDILDCIPGLPEKNQNLLEKGISLFGSVAESVLKILTKLGNLVTRAINIVEVLWVLAETFKSTIEQTDTSLTFPAIDGKF